MHLLETIIKCDYDVFTKMSDEIDAVLGYYAVYSGDSVPTFRDNLSVPSSRENNPKRLTHEDGTDRFVPKRR